MLLQQPRKSPLVARALEAARARGDDGVADAPGHDAACDDEVHLLRQERRAPKHLRSAPPPLSREQVARIASSDVGWDNSRGERPAPLRRP